MSDNNRHADIKALVDAGKWALALNTCETAEDRAALRDCVLKFLPTIRIENGIEVEERPVEPDDHVTLTGEAQAKAKTHLADASILEAAELLASGALDTDDGNPPRPEDEWSVIEAKMRAFLKGVAEAGEVTEGDGSMSRSGHAELGIEALDELATVISWARGECRDPEEVAWLDAIIADVARVAFVAGRHGQAAWGKEFEADAKIGVTMRRKGREGFERAEAERQPERQRILTEIRTIAVEQGVKSSKAAKILAEKDLRRQGCLPASWKESRRMIEKKAAAYRQCLRRHGPL